MKLTFLFFISLSLLMPKVTWSQYSYINKVDSLSSFDQSFGYGVSNIGDLIIEGANYRPSVYLDYSLRKSESIFYRIGASFSYRSVDIGNLKQREFIPTILTAGIEKHFYMDKFFGVLGADLFYSASAKHTTLSGFKVDDMGVGVAAYGGIGYVLRNDLSLFAQTEWGIGMYRVFAPVGGVTIATLEGRASSIRSLSFGIRHFF